MSINDKVDRDMRRLEHDGSLLLQDPELWVLKIARTSSGWVIAYRNSDEDECTELFTSSSRTVATYIRTFHSNLESLLSL